MEPKKKKATKKSPEIKKSQNNKANTGPKIYHFDAKGEKLGRFASNIAAILRGKNEPSFRPYKIPNIKVEIINASKIVLTGNKSNQKKYYKHSGYLGHLKETSYKEAQAKDPTFALKQAITGMLPKNKLQDKMLKNLNIYANEINEEGSKNARQKN